MLRSKKVLIAVCVIALLLIGGWWFLTRHTFPSHARYIPKNSIAVVSVNTKRIASDVLFGGGFQADTNSSSARKFIAWKKALDETSWAGMNLGADVLLFSNVTEDGKQWYNGMIFQLDDATKLSKFLGNNLPHLLDSLQVHATSLIDNKTYQSVMIVNDNSESPVCIGFNKEVAVILKANTPTTALAFYGKELTRIFGMSAENSLLSDENFKDAEKKSADITFWCNMGNPAVYQMLYHKKDSSAAHPGYLNAWINFEKGAIKMDFFTSAPDASAKPMSNGVESNFDFCKLVGKDKFMGMMFLNLNLPNIIDKLESAKKGMLTDAFFKNMGLSSSDIASAFNGKVEMAMNGFVTYKQKYLDYEYDADFNRTEVEKYRDAHIPGMVIRMGVTNSAALTPLLPKMLSTGIIIPWKNGFRIKSGDPVFLNVSGNYLYITTSEDIPKDLKEGDALANADLNDLHSNHANGVFVNFRGIEDAMNKDLAPNSGKNKVTEILENISISTDEKKLGTASSEFIIRFNDKKTNSLNQLIKLTTSINK